MLILLQKAYVSDRIDEICKSKVVMMTQGNDRRGMKIRRSMRLDCRKLIVVSGNAGRTIGPTSTLIQGECDA